MIALIFIGCFIFWILVGIGVTRMWKSPASKTYTFRVSIQEKDETPEETSSESDKKNKRFKYTKFLI